MEDDYNASSSWVFLVSSAGGFKVVQSIAEPAGCGFEDLPLELKRKQRAGVRRWWGAGCALALVCVCVSPYRALGQQADGSTPAANSSASPARPQQRVAQHSGTSTKKTSAKKTSTNSKAATSSPAAKTSAHPAAGTHPKASTAATAHNSKTRY